MITRRQAIAQTSPPMLVFLGVLVVEAIVSASTLIWNTASICRHRNDFEEPTT